MIFCKLSVNEKAKIIKYAAQEKYGVQQIAEHLKIGKISAMEKIKNKDTI